MRKHLLLLSLFLLINSNTFPMELLDNSDDEIDFIDYSKKPIQKINTLPINCNSGPKNPGTKNLSLNKARIKKQAQPVGYSWDEKEAFISSKSPFDKFEENAIKPHKSKDEAHFDSFLERAAYVIDPKDMDINLMERSLENAPERVLRKIQMYKKDPYAKNFRPTCILVGPPGTGKTTLGQAIAYALKTTCVFVDAAFLKNTYANSGPTNLIAIVDGLTKSKKNHVLLIDEITSLTDNFQNDQSDGMAVAIALWKTLDRVEQNRKIFLVATSNNVEDIPVQLKSRFMGNVILVDKLSEGERINKFKEFLEFDKEIILNIDPNDDCWRVINEKTSDFAIREIENLVGIIKECSFGVFGPEGRISITKETVLDALKICLHERNEILKIDKPVLTQSERLQKEAQEFQREMHDQDLLLRRIPDSWADLTWKPFFKPILEDPLLTDNQRLMIKHNTSNIEIARQRERQGEEQLAVEVFQPKKDDRWFITKKLDDVYLSMQEPLESLVDMVFGKK